MLRWLLPIVAALAVLGHAVTTFAAAGLVGDACCCPNPTLCKCHDHDRAPSPDPTMKRCSTDPQILITPDVLAAITPAPVRITELRLTTPLTHVTPVLHDTPPIPPEKPPF